MAPGRRLRLSFPFHVNGEVILFLDTNVDDPDFPVSKYEILQR